MIGSGDSNNYTFGLSTTARAVLASVAVLCIVFIAVVGVFKYKMDSVQAVLASPDSAFSMEGRVVDRVSVALGYGGFLGAAQNLVLKRDVSAVGDL